MSINKFKITRAPLRATIEIEAVAYVLDQEYSILKQASTVIKTTNVGVPYDSFGYKLGSDDGTWSSEINVDVNVEVNTGTPTHSTISELVKGLEINDITSSFNFDTNTDRVRFSLGGYNQSGNFLINKANLDFNKEYFIYEILTIDFISSNSGEPQSITSVIEMQVGNINEWSSSIDIIMTSSANLQVKIENVLNLVTGTLTTI